MEVLGDIGEDFDEGKNQPVKPLNESAIESRQTTFTEDYHEEKEQ